MMNSFVGPEKAAKQLFSYQYVFEHVGIRSSARMTARVDQDVTSLMTRTATAPIAVGGTDFATARAASIGLDLLPPATAADAPPAATGAAQMSA